MRSALAWLARLALGVVVLAAVIVAMLLITTHTGWGREQLRSRVEAALHDTFPGGARVGALEGSLLGTLTLRDVELDHAAGKPMITIAALRLDIALWPLATRTARIHHLVADGVRVAIPPSSPGPPPGDAPPSPWRIELEHVAVRRAALEIDVGGTQLALSDLVVTGSGTVDHGIVTLFAWSHGRWPERRTELTAMVAVVLDRDIRVPVAHIALDGATVTATHVILDPTAPDVREPVASTSRNTRSFGDATGGGSHSFGDTSGRDSQAAVDPSGGGASSRGTPPSPGLRSHAEPRSPGSRSIVDDLELGGMIAVSTSGRALAALVPELGLSPDAADQLGGILATLDVGATRSLGGANVDSGSPSLGGRVHARTPSDSAVGGARTSSDGAGGGARTSSDGARGGARTSSGGVGIAAQASTDGAGGRAGARETRLEVRAKTDAGKLWASLRGDLVRGTARGVVSVADIDLDAATHGRWCGRGSAIAALDGSVDRVRGTVIVNAGVLDALQDLDRLRGEPVGACGVTQVAGPAAIVALEATLDRATVAVIAGGDAEPRAGGDAAPHAFAVATARRCEASAVASGRRCEGTVVLDDAHAVVRAKTVAAAGQRITGQLTVAASASGRLAARATATGKLAPALEVQVDGHAAGSRLAVDDIAIASAQGPFTARVTSSNVLGTAHVTATGIRSGATPVVTKRGDVVQRSGGVYIASIRADIANRVDGTYRVAATARPDASGLEIFADARVAPRGVRILADIDRSRVTLPGGMVWAGRGGSVVVDPATIALRGVRLHGTDGSVALRGELTRASDTLVAHLASDRLTAIRINEGYRGVVSGTVDLVHRRGVWNADGRFDVRGTVQDAASHGAPLDAAAHVVLAGRRVTLDARAAGAALGSAELAVEATAPRDPFDARAWQVLDRRAIRSAAITARHLELSAVASLAVPPERVELRELLRGTLDGAVDYAAGGLRGSLAVRDVALPFAALDGDVTLTAQGADLGVRATARLSDLGSADMTARFALPDRPFDPATWQRGGRDLVNEASVAVADVAFDRERLTRLGLSSLLAAHGLDGMVRGRASMALALDAAAADARLAVEVNDLAGGTLVEPVSPRIAITAGPGGTHVQASLRARALSLGDLEGDVAMTLDRWIDEPAAVLHAPVTARWTLATTPAAPVLALFGRRDLAGGTFDASATVRGTLAAPAVAAHLGAREIAVAARLAGQPPAVLRDLDADASWEGGTGTLAVLGHEASGGELRARARGRLDTLADATATLTARRLDIAPLAIVATSVAPQLPGALVSATGMLDADLALAAGRLGGSLTLTGGALPISAAVGTLRDASARVAIDDRAIHATVRGRLGRGTIDLTANAATDLTTIDATLKLARVSPIAALRPVIDAHVDAKLRLGAERPCRPDSVPARLCGEIAIDNARIALPDHTSTPLLDASAPDDLVFVTHGTGGAAPVPRPPRSAPGPRPPVHPWLVASVTLGSTPIVAEDIAEGVTFHANVHSDQLAVSVGDTLGVRGRVEIDHADADVLGRRYVVEPSALTFEGSADPRIDIRMSHQFPDLALDVAMTGVASRPDLRLSSEPGGYTYDQLFGFFLGGEPGGDPGSQTGEAVAGAGARLLSGKLGRQINKVVPIKLDTVSCEPATSASTATGGSCTFGKWFSERLFLAYRQHFGGASDENTGDVQVQFRMGRKLLIEGAGGDRGHYGADLLWRHRW